MVFFGVQGHTLQLFLQLQTDHFEKGYIIDTRTSSTINSARSKGGGLEPDAFYPVWQKIHKSIDRFHFLLDSYSKLMEACCDTSASNEKWLNRLALSSWLTHVKEVLNCGCLVAQCVEKVINQPCQAVNFIDIQGAGPKFHPLQQ